MLFLHVFERQLMCLIADGHSYACV